MTQLSLLGGDEFAPPKRPSEPILRDALIEDKYRWWLKRGWGPGPAIAWVGLNPSLANGVRDDNTMLREIGFSFRWRYGSLVKLNIFPFISPSPAVMKQWLNSGSPDVNAALQKNLVICAEEIARCDRVMAAWGEADPEQADRFIFTLEKTLGRPVVWNCLALTASGAPRHTLARGTHYIPDSATPSPWPAPAGSAP